MAAKRPPPALRAVAGAVAGLVATALMDAAGTLYWERAMSPDVQKRERDVEPRFPVAVLGERVARALRAESVEQTGRRAATAIHWGIGLVCGALHGLLDGHVPAERRWVGVPVAAGMLSADEFGFPAAGLSPWPPAFPWQTHARAMFAHAVYGAATAVCYEGIMSYITPAKNGKRKR